MSDKLIPSKFETGDRVISNPVYNDNSYWWDIYKNKPMTVKGFKIIGSEIHYLVKENDVYWAEKHVVKYFDFNIEEKDFLID